MKKYNYAKLLGRMKECGLTQEDLAAKIGVCATSVNLSLNNKRDFRQCEMLGICETLCIPPESVCDYFFNQKL